jgi:hypothetical protein
MLSRTARTRRLAALGVGIGLLLSVTTSTAAVDPAASADPSAEPALARGIAVALAIARPARSPRPQAVAVAARLCASLPPPLLTVALSRVATSYCRRGECRDGRRGPTEWNQAAPWQYTFAVRLRGRRDRFERGPVGRCRPP